MRRRAPPLLGRRKVAVARTTATLRPSIFGPVAGRAAAAATKTAASEAPTGGSVGGDDGRSRTSREGAAEAIARSPADFRRRNRPAGHATSGGPRASCPLNCGKKGIKSETNEKKKKNRPAKEVTPPPPPDRLKLTMKSV